MKTYVVFTDGIYDKDKHCGILYYDKNIWILIDPTPSYVRVKIISDLLADKYIKESSFEYTPQPTVDIGAIQFYCCTSFVKQYLGIKNIHIITGNNLYNYLNGVKIPIWDKFYYPLRAIYYLFKFTFNKA